MRFRSALSLAALAAAITFSPAAAQRRPATPEQRIDRLEKQVRQMQRQVFPKGQPADTAGFSDAPAATQESVSGLNSRLDSVERQLADILRQAEENGNRVGVMEAEIARLRAEQDRRLRALETAPADAEPAAAELSSPTSMPPSSAPSSLFCASPVEARASEKDVAASTKQRSWQRLMERLSRGDGRRERPGF